MQRTWLRSNGTSTVQFVMLLCFRASVIGGAILLWIAGRASPGDVTYVLTSYYVIHAYLREVGMHINNLQRSVNDMEELVAIYGEPIGIVDAPDAKPIDIHGGMITFEDVTFRYDSDRVPLYDGLSINIRAGERIGLVGRSGSGKTTFVKLLQRLYDVSGGRILIDGQDIALATQRSLRSQIATVEQEPILFHRSLAENIAYGRPGASPRHSRVQENLNPAKRNRTNPSPRPPSRSKHRPIPAVQASRRVGAKQLFATAIA
ncbi:ABC-type multidrug transport system fused ATPase/permease subunit [Bradyrhizobium diazoefficiens]